MHGKGGESLMAHHWFAKPLLHPRHPSGVSLAPGGARSARSPVHICSTSLNNSPPTKCNSVVSLKIYHSYKHFCDIFLWKLISIIKKLISFRMGEEENRFISPN